ncbi:glutathione peroxidase [Ferruginibacter sp. HRS2-29]|uniref:glutathione peroxidase n=1 Tax=Ferruginibacter sp. HRS2-29 TaxID=2487334 RepID=UPI0020CC3DFB|nr:glutathione peroxidase [Ferruginibacter sp. HRS2-29]MCP9750457.1 glutathione peroxidase [Ferruginibacter sp. HRS2-29]
MTGRQKILKLMYPVLTGLTRLFGKNNKKLQSTTMANTSFYDLQITLNNGKPFAFSDLKGKKVMLVNTASDCGYTRQYDDLEKLYAANKDNLVIIGFPANDFGEQEKGDDATIEEFCRVNYGVTFPLAQKSGVKKNAEQNPVYQWLTDADKNGWNTTAPTWNFCKYIIDENGNLKNFFEASVEPMSKEVADAIR